MIRLEPRWHQRWRVAFDNVTEAISTNIERAVDYSDEPQVAVVFWAMVTYLIPYLVVSDSLAAAIRDLQVGLLQGVHDSSSDFFSFRKGQRSRKRNLSWKKTFFESYYGEVSHIMESRVNRRVEERLSYLSVGRNSSCPCQSKRSRRASRLLPLSADARMRAIIPSILLELFQE